MKKGVKGFLPGAIGMAALFASATSMVAFSSAVVAADVDTSVADTVLYWGADLALKGSNTYGLAFDGGFVTALNGNIDMPGWIVTGNLGYGHTKDVGSKTDSFYTTALVGYQWKTPDFYASLSAGVLYNNNDEKPGGGKTDGSKVGAAINYGFGTTASDAIYVQSYGTYATTYDQLYLHGKLGYKTASIAYGGEYTFYDDNGTKPTHRIGAFVGEIPLGEQLTMTVSGGYQTTKEPGTKDGGYATIGFSMPISLLR